MILSVLYVIALLCAVIAFVDSRIRWLNISVFLIAIALVIGALGLL